MVNHFFEPYKSFKFHIKKKKQPLFSKQYWFFLLKTQNAIVPQPFS
jgi:hypothetical protein